MGVFLAIFFKSSFFRSCHALRHRYHYPLTHAVRLPDGDLLPDALAQPVASADRFTHTLPF